MLLILAAVKEEAENGEINSKIKKTYATKGKKNYATKGIKNKKKHATKGIKNKKLSNQRHKKLCNQGIKTMQPKA